MLLEGLLDLCHPERALGDITGSRSHLEGWVENLAPEVIWEGLPLVWI
jgi:hypothetical protein